MPYALALLPYAAVAWYRPRLALGVLLALLPTYLVRFEVLGIPMTLLEGMVLVLAVVVLGCGRGGHPLSLPLKMRGRTIAAASPFADRMVVLAVLWVVAGLLAAMWSDAGAAAWGIWKAYIVEPVLAYFVIRALNIFSPLRTIVLPILVGAAGVAGVAIWQHWSGYGIPFPWFDVATRRVTSVFGYPNAVGLYLAPLVPLAFGMVAITRRRTPPL
ncbi:MAG: hypothetical protein Q7S96_05040 [bacterium]|nr:hypothetical protein [bacterium]